MEPFYDTRQVRDKTQYLAAMFLFQRYLRT